MDYEKEFDLPESLAFIQSDIKLKLKENDSFLSRGARIKKILMLKHVDYEDKLVLIV